MAQHGGFDLLGELSLTVKHATDIGSHGGILEMGDKESYRPILDVRFQEIYDLFVWTKNVHGEPQKCEVVPLKRCDLFDTLDFLLCRDLTINGFGDLLCIPCLRHVSD